MNLINTVGDLVKALSAYPQDLPFKIQSSHGNSRNAHILNSDNDMAQVKSSVPDYLEIRLGTETKEETTRPQSEHGLTVHEALESLLTVLADPGYVNYKARLESHIRVCQRALEHDSKRPF